MACWASQQMAGCTLGFMLCWHPMYIVQWEYMWCGFHIFLFYDFCILFYCLCSAFHLTARHMQAINKVKLKLKWIFCTSASCCVFCTFPGSRRKPVALLFCVVCLSFHQLEMLTCGCCPATYVVIFIIKLDSHPFAIASRHPTAAAPAQWDRDNSVDVSQHDGDTDAYTTQCKHTHTVEVLSRANCKLQTYSIFIQLSTFRPLESSSRKSRMACDKCPNPGWCFYMALTFYYTKETLLNNLIVVEKQMVKESESRGKREKTPFFLPTVTAATTGDTITDSVTPPAITKFLLCLEMSLPS